MLVVLLLAMAAGQGPSMPPPGNPGHVEPAPGALCVHEGQPGADAGHVCSCHATCMENRDGNGEPNGTFTKQEDNAKCRAACFKHSCACASDCETS